MKSNLVKRLQAGEVSSIKLIGDSITFGVGATGAGDGTNPDGAVIFTDADGYTYRESKHEIPTWANFFRQYINTNFPSVTFFNAGIGGKSSKWANARKNLWVADNEDLVFVMLGTNDRWDTANPAEFEANLTEFLAYVNERSNTMIVMSATPTTSDNEPDKNFGMEEVDRVITKVCFENGYSHISHYRLMLDYLRYTRKVATDFIQSAGSHPIDAGYKVMWQHIQQELGLIDNQDNWFDFREELQSIKVLSDWASILPTTPITEKDSNGKDVFNLRAITSVAIPNGHGLTHGFPENTGGMLTTYRFSLANDMYVWQEYNVYISDSRYRRRWSGTGWMPWLKESQMTTIDTLQVDAFTLNANSWVRKALTTTQVLSSTNLYIVSPISFIPDGVIWSWTKASNNLLYINFYNAQGINLNLSNLIFKVTQITP